MPGIGFAQPLASRAKAPKADKVSPQRPPAPADASRKSELVARLKAAAAKRRGGE